MNIKMYESELHVMEVLWERGDLPAKEIAGVLNEKIGWNKNTTYTVIKKCISKGAVQRYGTNFMCRPLITRKQVQVFETNELIAKVFHGARLEFFNTFLKEETFTPEELDDLKKLIQKIE